MTEMPITSFFEWNRAGASFQNEEWPASRSQSRALKTTEIREQKDSITDTEALKRINEFLASRGLLNTTNTWNHDDEW